MPRVDSGSCGGSSGGRDSKRNRPNYAPGYGNMRYVLLLDRGAAPAKAQAGCAHTGLVLEMSNCPSASKELKSGNDLRIYDVDGVHRA